MVERRSPERRLGDLEMKVGTMEQDIRTITDTLDDFKAIRQQITGMLLLLKFMIAIGMFGIIGAAVKAWIGH